MPERPPERKEITVLEDIADGITIFAPPGGLPVIGPLTDEELRAVPVPVSGPLTNAEIRATSLSVTGPLTDTQLRAAPVPVSGPMTNAEMRATPVNVAGPLTDAQLRAAGVPVSGTAAVGQAPTLPPLSISGVDGGGLKRHIRTDVAGVVQVSGLYEITITTTLRTLAANTNQQLVAANAARKFLHFINIDLGRATLLPGSTPAVMDNGIPLDGAAVVGGMGAQLIYNSNAIPTSAFQGISTVGTRILVLEGV